MECVTAQVKRWLNAARNEHDSSSVQKAFHVLTAACAAADTGMGLPPSSELYILCCEESILLEQWEMAQKCVDAFHCQLTCNRMLEARALYCDAIVRAHFISEDLSWSEAVEERLHCATPIIRGITIAVEEWPREAWAVIDGIEKLWLVVAPLYQFGHFKCLIEILAFVVSLHEKLMIGGGYTFIQWVTRLAVCLRGSGRVQDGIHQLHVALDSAVRMNQERLQVQLLRMLTVFNAEVVNTTVALKGKQEAPKGLIHQAVQLVHLFLLGQMDINVAKPELIAVYDRLTLVGGSNERDATSLLLAPPAPVPPPPPPPSSFSSSSSSSQQSMNMQGGKNKNRIRPTVPELISDPEVLQEVLSDVVFCMAFCNDGKRCEESIQKLTSSNHPRARTFGNYAKILVSAFDAGVFDVIDAPDASYLTPAVVEFLFQSIQEIESTMDGAKRIQDGSERSYAIQVGCSLLWNFCLPLLQESTHASLQHVLNRIVKETDECSLCRHSFQVMVEYESSVAEYNEDNLSLAVRRIRKALSRGYCITYPDGTTYAPMNLSLLWLLRRCELRVSTEGSEVTSTSNSPVNQDLAMFYLEQAESTTTTSKFVSLIKASFNKLPVLAVEDPPLTDLSSHSGIVLHPTSTTMAPTTTAMTTTTTTTSHTSSVRESREGSTTTSRKRAASSLAPLPGLPKLSLTRLYLHLLQACVDHPSPALLPFAKSCALSLCAIHVLPDVKYSEYIFMKGHASLLLCKVLLMEYHTVVSEDEKKAIADHLFQALQDASAIEHVLQGVGRKSAWITINACLLYLDYKAPTFSAGNFQGASEELGEMYRFFMSLLYIDFDRECRLTADLSLFYLLSLLDDYVRARGGFANPPPRSYDEFVDAVLRFQPRGESKGSDAPGLASLRRAHEVCMEAMQKIVLPAKKQHLSRLYPAIVRLLNLKSGSEPSFVHHPQEWLLQCIGRLAGPTTVEEKKALLTKEVWEWLQHDPSVQLCGQVACFAMDVGEERLVLEICELAHQLFHAGKLGWGTVYLVTPVVPEKEKLSKQEKKEAPVLAATLQPNAPFPPPQYLDWLFYGKLLRFQAEVLHRRSGGIHAASKEGLSLEVLKHCVNSAIAASHGPPALRNHEVVAAIQLFYRTISTLWRSDGVPNAKLLPSLKMMLSPHILCHLSRTDGGEKVGGGGGATDLGTTPPSSPLGSPGSPFRSALHTASASSSAAKGRSVSRALGGTSGASSRYGRGGGLHQSGSNGGGGGGPGSSLVAGLCGSGSTGHSGEGGAGVQIRYDHLHEVLSTLGHMLLRACASDGLFEDGMQAIQSVLSVLPKKYHSSYMVQNVRFRCAVGLPVESILHDAKSDDCETASVVWMTFAQQTSDQGKAVEAWKYAVNVLTGYPFAKATCLLEMVYHVCTHGLLPLREVQLLLLSALDLVEGFDRSVNDTCVVAAEVLQPVMDERARSFPGKLIGTLTGRSLILASMDVGEGSSLVAALRKNLPPISLKDLLLAIRIVFMIFTVAPYKVGKEEVSARTLAAAVASGGGGSGKAGAVIAFITKRECALLLLHYIDCLWRLTASIVRKEMQTGMGSAVASSPSASSSSTPVAPPPPPPPPPPPLDPPKRLGGWFGFFFHETHVRLLANAVHQDFKHNTEGLQGIFFALGQFLMEENMEHYCFMLYMWTAFAAGWRYGCEDVQYEEVKRAAYLGCEVAASCCGAGYQANIYSLPELLPHHRAALDAKLDESKAPSNNLSTRSPSSSSLPSALSPAPPPPILFSPHIGSLQDVWIRKTILLASLECGASAMEKVQKIQQRCAQMGDWDNYAKCVLLHIKELWIRKQFKTALEVLVQEEQAGLIEKLTPSTWERWEAHKTELLMHMGSGKAIMDASARFVSTAHRLRERFPVDTVGREVSDNLFPHLVEVYHVELLQSIGPLLLSSIESGGVGIPSTVGPAAEKELRTFVVELCESLENSPHIRIRMAVKRCQLLLRAPLLSHPSIPTIRRALTSLEKESAQVESIFAEVAVTTAEMSSALCLQTTDTLLRPSQNLVEAFFLFLRGENIMSRFRIAQSILDAYRCLSLEELGIPTGGPPALEKHVMDFIRDPTKRRGPDSELEEKRWREAKWTRKMNDIDVETNNALDYYSIPRNLIGQNLSAFECRAALYQAMEVVGPPCSSSYFTISKAIVRVELRCLLERELAMDHTGVLSVEERMEDLLNERWSVCPLTEVTKVVVNKRGGVGGGSTTAGGGGGGGGGGANGSEKHRKTKDHHMVEWTPRIPPKEFTEADATLLHRLWEMIRDAARKFEHSQLYESFLLLADFYTLWQRPQSAGTAVEFALAARLIGYLTELCFGMMEDTEERRAWRRVQRFLSQRALLAYSTRFNGIRQAALDASPMLAALNLPEEWPDEVETSTSFAFGDSVVLSITQVRHHPSYFFVVLRHPDGVVDSRRQAIHMASLQELVTRYENFLEERRQVILEETRRLGVSRQETAITAEDLQEFGRQIYPVLQPLLQHIEESLENLASKDLTLYLCLDPLLQPLPFAYLPVFSGFSSIHRELSVVFIKRKLELKNSKSASGVLQVIDPFGDYLPSVEGLGNEGKKGSRDVHLLTATDKRFPFSLEYLMWIIEQQTYQAVLFNMCGSLTSLLSPAAAASIKWSHIFMVVIGADAVNESSMRREQKNELTKSPRDRLFGKKWLLPLILLLRGVRYIAVSTCPTTPAANDALCRRALPALSTGRSVLESSTNRHGSPGKFGREGKKVTETVKRQDLFTLYGVPFSAMKTK